MSRTLLAAILVALLGACNEKPKEPIPPSPPVAPATTTKAKVTPKATGNKAANIHWEKPAAWKAVDHPSRMRKATYEITAVDGDSEPGQMSVTQVGGSIDANIQRWEGQFTEKPKAERSTKTVNGIEVTTVKLSGTFSGSGMPGAAPGPEKKDWAMLAAIADTARGAHFFKLTGPKRTVDAAQGDFEVLVSSIAPKN